MGRRDEDMAVVLDALRKLGAQTARIETRLEALAETSMQHASRLARLDPVVDADDPQSYVARRRAWEAENPDLAHLPAGSPEGQSAPPQFAEVLTPGEVARAVGIGDIGEAMSDLISAGDPEAASRRSQRAHSVASILSAMSRSGVVASYTDLPGRPPAELTGRQVSRERSDKITRSVAGPS